MVSVLPIIGLGLTNAALTAVGSRAVPPVQAPDVRRPGQGLDPFTDSQFANNNLSFYEEYLLGQPFPDQVVGRQNPLLQPGSPLAWQDAQRFLQAHINGAANDFTAWQADNVALNPLFMSPILPQQDPFAVALALLQELFNNNVVSSQPVANIIPRVPFPITIPRFPNQQPGNPNTQMPPSKNPNSSIEVVKSFGSSGLLTSSTSVNSQTQSEQIQSDGAQISLSEGKQATRLSTNPAVIEAAQGYASQVLQREVAYLQLTPEQTQQVAEVVLNQLSQSLLQGSLQPQEASVENFVENSIQTFSQILSNVQSQQEAVQSDSAQVVLHPQIVAVVEQVQTLNSSYSTQHIEQDVLPALADALAEQGYVVTDQQLQNLLDDPRGTLLSQGIVDLRALAIAIQRVQELEIETSIGVEASSSINPDAGGEGGSDADQSAGESAA